MNLVLLAALLTWNAFPPPQAATGRFALRPGPADTTPVRPSPVRPSPVPPSWTPGKVRLPFPPEIPPPDIVEDGAVDLLETQLDVSFSPDGRTVDATAVYTVQVVRPVGTAFYLWVDQALEFTSAQTDGYSVLVQTADYAPFKMATVRISPTAQPGEILRVRLAWSGTLACAPHGARESRYCGSSPDVRFYLAGGPFPLFMDAADPYGALLYRMDLTLRTPADWDLLVAADAVEETVDGAVRVSRWQADTYTSGMNLIVLAGDFDSVPVSGAAPPAAVWHAAARPEWAAEMAQWTALILPFLDDLAGRPFPFGKIDVFKLPALPGFPGTATWGSVYLAETYAAGGALWFEEILAHEISHLWWGILAAQTDLARNALMTEGMAVTSQMEYIRRRHFPQDDADRHMAEQLRRHRLYLWHLTDPHTLPPIQLPAGQEWPNTVNEQVVWAYYKTSAFLDMLRVLVGDEAFFGALRAYVDACFEGECDIAGVEAIFSQHCRRDLSGLFDAFVYASTFVHADVGIRLCARNDVPCQTRVFLAHDGPTPLSIPLLLHLDDGTVQKERVDVPAAGEEFVFSTPRPAVSVEIDPRLVFYQPRSQTPGDVDFDGETDGFDLIAVVQSLGRRAVDEKPDPGLYDIDLAFEPRLDLDGDGIIAEEDVNIVLAGFGSQWGGAR